MAPIIRVSSLNKYFGRLHVLKEISFEVEPSEVVCIIGPSGSGKSTLLRCVNFLEHPNSGEIEVDGLVVPAEGKGREYHRRIHDLRMRTGMVFQDFNLFPHLNALENVTEAPITVKGKPKAEAAALAEKYLGKVGLLAKKNEYPARLSGGQKQRVAIARALAMEPRVMLFDEPTSALDPELIGEVLEVMKQLAREGMTMLVVTHEMGFAREVANRVIFLHEGECVESGPPAQIFGNAQTDRARTFIGSILGRGG